MLYSETDSVNGYVPYLRDIIKTDNNFVDINNEVLRDRYCINVNGDVVSKKRSKIIKTRLSYDKRLYVSLRLKDIIRGVRQRNTKESYYVMDLLAVTFLNPIGFELNTFYTYPKDGNEFNINLDNICIRLF